MQAHIRFIFLVLSAFVLLTVGSTAPSRSVLAGSPGSSALVASRATATTITKYPGTVRKGAYASVSVHTAARASCSVAVYYKSGRSVAAGLYTKRATSAGNVSWTWKVGTRTTPGSWPVVISCGGSTVRTVVNVR